MDEPNVFTLLDRIAKHPSRYLSAGELARGEQLRELAILLDGYALALHLHQIPAQIVDFRAAFAEFLAGDRGWDTRFGPYAAIRAHAASDDAAWSLFWTLIEEFRKFAEDATLSRR
jgi:hypothetical protein